MAGELRGHFRVHLRTLFDAGTTNGLTDGQLLERFATRRDEGSELAFAALVKRHGPMVLRACRGILRDDHEAMDAFQATFLVLARKGGSLWVRDSLGPWLHRVACHAAGRARSTAARRRASEKKAVEMAEHRNGGDDREELASVIHEEVNRLPERYRSAVVLCDLEGRTCEEAARHLGCPVGTVGSRLSRGRQRLRDRLSRRGLDPRGGLAFGMVAWRALREPIPSELVGSTAGAAGRFLSIQAVPRGPAALLALGVLRSMAMTRWWKVASILLALTASTSGVVSLVGRGAAVAEARPEDAPKGAQTDGVAFAEVKPGKLSVVVEERGLLEASRNSDVVCMVEGQVTIISIVPEGTRVTKGQLVCELDASSLNDELAKQLVIVKSAEAAFEAARLSREVAEIAVQEYVEAVYPKDSQDVLNEIALAKSSITSAEQRLKRLKSAVEQLDGVIVGQKGTQTPAGITATLDLEDRLVAAEQALDQGRRALEIGQARRDLLEKFTRDKTIKQLRIEVEKRRPAELAHQSAFALERTKEERLHRQIANCKILAPSDGTMVYANDWPRSQIEVGVAVRERQKIFSLPNIFDPMRVVTMIPEAVVDKLSLGLTAQVAVHAFPGQDLLGVVESVAPVPDPAAYVNRKVKVYPTQITITNRIRGLRPGMSASVKILVAERDNVLSVPIQAVVSYDNKEHVAVKTADGSVDWHEVTLGLSDGKVVEVKEGLKTGESVALEPAMLLSEVQKRNMTFYPRYPKALGPGEARPKAKAKAGDIPSSIRTKLQAMPPEDRVKLREASAQGRESLLKKAGFTDDEVVQYNQLRQRSGGPR